MAITYKWSIPKMTVNPSIDGKTDVVIYADWMCVGTDDVNNLTAAAAGTAVSYTHLTLPTIYSV